LRAAWDAFARGDMAVASAGFQDAVDDTTEKAVAAEALFGLAHAAYAAGAPARAAAVLEQALALAADDPAIRHSLSRAWAPMGYLERGIKPAKVGLSVTTDANRPQRLKLLRLLAEIYDRANDVLSAILVYYAIISIPPRDAPTLARIGYLWMRGGNQQQAVSFFHKAVVLDPNYLYALDGMASALWIEGDVAGARAALFERAAKTTDPVEKTVTVLKSAIIQPAITMDDAEIDEARARFSQAIAAGPAVQIPDPWRAELGPNFYANYHARPDRALHEAIVQYFLKATPSLDEVRSPTRRAPGAKIRLGLVSNYFCEHVVGYLNHGLIRNLDRERFEITLFRTPNAKNDAVTRAMAALAPLIDLPADLAAARRLIAEAELDVLHYLEIGMDHFSYFLAYARLAPLQTTTWGHPLTTGLPTIDLFLSQDDMEPDDGAEHYTERLIRLRNLSIDVAPPITPDDSVTRSDLGLKAPGPAYVCAQSLYKLHHAFDATLALILDRDPQAQMYFVSHSAHADARFAERLQRRVGAHMNRVHILPRVTPENFLRLVRAADVLLDVPQWAGGKTSLESFAMGTPIVHWPGQFMRGRHTLMFLRRMGITATIADSAESYADIAIRLVHDADFRRDIRAQIAANSHRLFNDTPSIREIEDVWTAALRERT